MPSEARIALDELISTSKPAGLQGPSQAQRMLDEMRLKSEAPPLDVDRSPIELEPAKEQTFGVEGGIIPSFTIAPDEYTAYEREASARGVDVNNELEDRDLRKALGFSPNDAFSMDFLAKKLAEETGLPAHQLIQQAPNGKIEFYNPETKRFTPVDSRNVTWSDLSDIYGPTLSIGAAVTGGVVGALAGPYGSVSAGALGAFLGEVGRLQHGKNIGVHDLSQEDMLEEGLNAAKLDVAFGLGGIAVGELRRLGRSLMAPTGLTPEHAESILANLGKHKDDLDRVNALLEAAGSKNKFKLDPVADAEDILGIEMRDAAASATPGGRARRAAEIKANKGALQDLAKILNKIDTEFDDVLSNIGAPRRAAPAQAELKAERARIEERVNSRLRDAEGEAMRALEELGTLSRREAGEELKAMINHYSVALESNKDMGWIAYQQSIGQKIRGDAGFTEANRLVSNIQVPITDDVVASYTAAQAARRQSLLAKKSQGARTLKKVDPEAPGTIDLAVLDDDIKEIRDILRRGDPGFSARKLKHAEEVLVNLRNKYLAKNMPETYALLQTAEDATTVFKNFSDKSVFSHILKRNPDGKLVVADVDAFREIMKQESGEMMSALVEIAKGQPGGVEALQAMGMKFYKANVIPDGSNIMSLELHNAFIKKNEEVLTALFDDPRFLRFGQLEARVAKAAERVKETISKLQDTPLVKLGPKGTGGAGVHPENMAAAVFSGRVSERGIFQTLRVLDRSPIVASSFRQSVGREVYRRITKDGVLNAASISNLVETQGGKLRAVFGTRYVNDLKALGRMIDANVFTQSGREIPSTTLQGFLLRALVAPPLTTRGRVQTWIERARKEAALRVISAAVRDKSVLRSIIRNRDMDVKTTAVLSILGLTGGAAIALEE